MQTSHNQLFVYGSLRSDFGHPAYASYISEHFVLLGPARVKGKVYDLGEFPGAVPTSAQDYITGELYRLREGQDFDWAMAQLDDYEGLHENPPLYSRETALVYTPNETTTAWMYWYNQPVDENARIVSGDVMQYLQEKSNDGKQMNQ